LFILGLLVGPSIGVLIGDYLFRPEGPRWQLSLAGIVLLELVILFFPVFVLELKLPLMLGVVVGVLLAATPMVVGGAEQSA
jgi:membrane-associated PAP2 superfamily phosphatase